MESSLSKASMTTKSRVVSPIGSPKPHRRKLSLDLLKPNLLIREYHKLPDSRHLKRRLDTEFKSA